MRMSEGVEWAAHCCLTLDWLAEVGPVPTAKLAAAFEVPPPYLNKQLQALVRAGILTSTPGARGGFRLARPLERITLLDVVTAIEGPAAPFVCTEIRLKGVGKGTPRRLARTPCAIASAMREAEAEWRRALAARTLAQVREAAEARTSGQAMRERHRRWYLTA
jgi:Rrf2 family protein